eukprot:1171273-Rhodomonas_salina.2
MFPPAKSCGRLVALGFNLNLNPSHRKRMVDDGCDTASAPPQLRQQCRASASARSWADRRQEQRTPTRSCRKRGPQTSCLESPTLGLRKSWWSSGSGPPQE